MSGRLLRSIFDTRLIAVGLLALQLGLSTGGHLLHAWMHALQDGPQACGTCVRHASAHAATVPEAGREDNCSTGCCSSRQTLALDRQADNCCGDPALTSVAADSIPLSPYVESSSNSHRCWSEDCAFYRGIHQTLTLTEQLPEVSLDQLSERLAAPADAAALTSVFFSLRARGPPSA